MSVLRRGARGLLRRLATAWWLVPLVLGVALLWPSLVGRTILVPTDLQLAVLPWDELPGTEAPPDNVLLRDLIDTYVPEQATIWERILGEGDPSWLEGSGMGGPGWWFIGNGALSPFVALWHLLDMPIRGLALGALARIAVGGAGIGMVVRGQGGSRAAAALAGGCFAMSGFMVGWLGWPQSGVAAMVGWVWWATRRAARPDAPWWSVGVLGVAVAAAWLAGFPSVAALLLISAAGVAVAESGVLHGIRHRRWRPGLPGMVRAGVGLGAGTGLAALQLLPSLAFLDAVDLSAREQAWRATMPPYMLLRWLVPDAFGDGEAVAYWGQTNLIESAASIGVAALVLALAAAVLRGGRSVLGWGLVAVAALAVAYGIGGAAQLVALIPGVGTNPPARALVLAAAALSVLAGLGLDAVRGLGPQVDPTRLRRRRMAAAGAVAGVVLLVAATSASAVARVVDRRLADPDARAAAADLVVRAGLVAVALLAATVVVSWLLRRRPDGRFAAVLTGVLVVVAVGEPFLAAVGWNSQRPDTELYPDAPEIAHIVAAAPPPARVAGTPDVLLPMTDLRYPYDDARGRRFVTEGQRALILAAGGRFASPTRWDLSFDPGAWTGAVAAMGVTAIVVPPASPLTPLPHVPSGPDLIGPLVDGHPHEVTVQREGRGRIDAVVVRVETGGADVEGRLVVEVTEADGRTVLGSVQVQGIRDSQLVEVPLDAPVRLSRGSAVTIAGTATDAEVGVRLFGRDGVVDAAGTRGEGWQATDVGHLRIVQVPAAIPWASLVQAVAPWPSAQIPGRIAETGRSGAVVRATRADAARLRAQAGDGLRLTRDVEDLEPDPSLGIPDLLVDGRRIRAVVDAGEDGAVLRVLEPDLPGWTATVDGGPVDVVTVDAAFVGVGVPAGRHVVELRWSAPWLTAGWAVTGASAGLLAGWTLVAALHPARRSGLRTTEGADRGRRPRMVGGG